MPKIQANIDPPQEPRYDLVARSFHAALGLGIVGTFLLGLQIADMPMSLSRLKYVNWHKWAGVVILFLSALRLLWRLTHKPPAVIAMPAWQKRAAHAMHMVLYALFFAVPLVGWAYSSAAGFPIVVFGVFPLPDFVRVDRILASVFKTAHMLLAYGLAGCVVLHIAAALKHQFIDRHALLQRMLPWPRRG